MLMHICLTTAIRSGFELYECLLVTQSMRFFYFILFYFLLGLLLEQGCPVFENTYFMFFSDFKKT